MSRNLHFGIGVALGFLCFCFVVMAFMVYVASAASPGGSSIGGGVIFFGLLALAAGFGALRSIARAFRPPPRKPRSADPTPQIQSQIVAEGMTPDEKLAHLVKKMER